MLFRSGYYEYVPNFDEQGHKIGEVCHWRGPGHFRFCRADSFHRIELKDGVTAWTLFMPGPHQREWGFLVGKGKKQRWEHNEDYLARRGSTTTV